MLQAQVRTAARGWQDKMDRLVQVKFEMHLQNLPSPKTLKELESAAKGVSEAG